MQAQEEQGLVRNRIARMEVEMADVAGMVGALEAEESEERRQSQAQSSIHELASRCRMQQTDLQ